MARDNLKQARAQLVELVQRAMLGEDVILTESNKPVARIVSLKQTKRLPGTGKGIWMAPDFDETPESFAGYV